MSHTITKINNFYSHWYFLRVWSIVKSRSARSFWCCSRSSSSSSSRRFCMTARSDASRPSSSNLDSIDRSFFSAEWNFFLTASASDLASASAFSVVSRVRRAGRNLRQETSREVLTYHMPRRELPLLSQFQWTQVFLGTLVPSADMSQ